MAREVLKERMLLGFKAGIFASYAAGCGGEVGAVELILVLLLLASGLGLLTLFG
jgi:hypothetical protein